MAFPATGQVTAEAFRTARNVAVGAKVAASALRNASGAGDVTRQSVVSFLQTIASAVLNWQQVATTPGLAAYAQSQMNDPTLDIAAEFNAMVAAGADLRDWIFANFPKGAGGAWLTVAYDNQGAATPLVFTSADLAQLRTRLATFEATIS